MPTQQGRLIGVSLGPGDPQWITRGAWSALQSAAHWTYPVKKSGAESYALEIVQRSGLAIPARNTALVFPMTKDAEILAKSWAVAGRQVLELLNGGEDVLFLVEGDASTYSTFNHVRRAVQALDGGVAVEVIPGVTSFNAAAARLQDVLCDQDETVAIVPAAYGVAVIEQLLAQFDTIALLKVNPVLDQVLDMLQQKGIIEHARFVEKAGSEQEWLVEDVRTLRGRKVSYLSLMLVHNPNRVKPTLQRGCRKK
ncbi:cobalt-factor II C20-methyltransferase [Magnetococcus marinus MC-1]|uniref:Cobalt-factor II C20-methyltransferase n=1 Tax=Magnetococcus marinus (strain ATCC BAA-1437 / JCM 17883 / MC-1) TaxID=156889 RepID=A0LCC8_MAGMM|nr:precorrin-2 C(20)-methyltransferase [Magnetococcus marinus]ABK45621.1 cobalt-factor II C20-methyltransferase [Magnetococcus marinus MC-1]